MKKNSCVSFYCVYVLIFSFIFFDSISLQAQSKVPVKSQTEYALETKGGKETEIKRHYQAFDQHGNLVDEIDYDSEGRLKEETKYEYNQKNEKVKETHFADDGKIDEISSYEYDVKGNRISKMVTDVNGKLKSKKKYLYEYY
jgi:hypothetical protein